MSFRPKESSAEVKDRKVISRLTGFADLDPVEIQRLVELGGSRNHFERGDIIRSETEHNLYLLVDGWAASAVILADGSRQLVSVNLPGDILGLPGLAMREPIDAVMALTPVETIRIGQDQIGELFTASPRIAAIMFLISQEERSLLMERLALTGQADALTRLAALILRLHERHALSEEDPERGFFMPLTQREMGELIGVSSVHTNSLIKQLRVEGVVSVANRSMVIHDPSRLSEIAGVPPWHRSKPRWLPKTVAP